MKKKLFFLPLILTVGFLINYYNIDYQTFLNDFSKFLENKNEEKQVITDLNQESLESFNTFKIANWNLQIFGKSKASKPELMEFYEKTLENKYDIIFIQEIRDKSQTAFASLCDRFEEYNCLVSSRAGQSTSKEQYGIIYKKGIEASIRDYNRGAYTEQFNRPPVAVDFRIDSYSFTALNIHTDPDVVPEEIGFLESVILENEKSSNIILLGDLNADCNYYNNNKETHFDSWNWKIGDDKDTTVSQTDCAYDRIILNDGMNEEFISYGIFDEINKSQSDHYLIWGEFKLK